MSWNVDKFKPLPTIPASAPTDFKLGNARPRKRYSQTQKSTGVMDFTVMNVSSGAYFITRAQGATTTHF